MIHVSSEFREQMEMRTDFKEQAEVTFLDGTKLSLTEDDFTVSNNSIMDGAGSNGLPLGAAIQRQVQIELMNDDDHLEKYDFVGAQIRLYMTFWLPKTKELKERIEKIECGYFTVTKPETYGQTVIVAAVDDMYRADKAFYSDLIFPVSASELFIEMCEHCGIQPGNTLFRNNDFTIKEKPSGSDLTFRAVFGYLAMLAAGNARISRQGTLEILSYDFSVFDQEGVHIQELRNFNSLKIGTEDVVITGIRMKVKGKTAEEDQTFLCGKEGYLIEVENPLVAGQEQQLVDSIGQRLIGVHLRDFSGDHIAYPLAEFMDPVYVEDRKGRKYPSVLTDIDFTFFGITTLKNSAVSAIRNSSKFSSEASKTYEEARNLITNERKARDTAIKNLARKLESSSGLYCTKDEQPDGSTIYYMHDKLELSDSMIIWKLTAEAIGISTDGGKTYPYGLDVSGTAILERLHVTGINAKYVKIGEETVTEYIERIEKDAEDALESLKKTVTTQGSSLETMQNQIREKVWKSDITTEIDGLKIGGRNYAKNSASLRLVPNGTDNYDLEIPLYRPQVWDAVKNAGHEYTVSFDMQAESALTEDYTTQVWIKQAPWYSAGKITYPKGSTQKVHYSLTAKADDDTLNANLFIRFMKKDTVPMLLTKIKVEAGNRETDWILAPEDVQENIDTAQTSADQAKTTITETSAQVETIKTATEALTKAIQSYVKTDDFTKYQKQIESQLSQTPEAITARFTAIEQTLADASDNASGRLSKLESYIQMTADGIILGRSDDPITLVIQNGQICFMQSGTKVAWFTNNQLYISNATITETANIVGLTVTKSGRHLQIN